MTNIKNKTDRTSTMVLDSNLLNEELNKENSNHQENLNTQDLILLKKFQINLIFKKNPTKPLQNLIGIFNKNQIAYSSQLPLQSSTSQIIIVQISDYNMIEIEKITSYLNVIKIAHLPEKEIDKNINLNLKKFKILIHDFEMKDLLDIIRLA